MLAIKFSRKGKKNQPFFRIIVLEKSKDPWGDFLEDLGHYNPLTKQCSLKEERIKYWLEHGAQPTGSVHNLLVNKGIIKGKKVKVTKKRVSKKKREEKPKEEKEGLKPKKDIDGKPEEKPGEKKQEKIKKSPTKEEKEEKKEAEKEAVEKAS